MALKPHAWRENSETPETGPSGFLLGGRRRRRPAPKTTRTSSPHFCRSFIGSSQLHFTPLLLSAHKLTSLSVSSLLFSPLSDVCHSALTTGRVWPEGGPSGGWEGGGCHGAGCDTRPPQSHMFNPHYPLHFIPLLSKFTRCNCTTKPLKPCGIQHIASALIRWCMRHKRIGTEQLKWNW